jgi:hypothetical protein
MKNGLRHTNTIQGRYSAHTSLGTLQILDLHINPLNAELNPICHSLILFGDLTFMGMCIVSIFQYIFNKMQRYTVYLYLELLYTFRVILPPIIRSAYNYLLHLVFVTPLLLSRYKKTV